MSAARKTTKRAPEATAKAVSRRAAPAAKRATAKRPASAKSQRPVPAPSSPEARAKAKPPKSRLVRDSFTMPESDFALIAALKARALAAQREAKKSELLRAGLQVLTTLDVDALLSALGRLQPLKVGRPRKS